MKNRGIYVIWVPLWSKFSMPGILINTIFLWYIFWLSDDDSSPVLPFIGGFTLGAGITALYFLFGSGETKEPVQDTIKPAEKVEEPDQDEIKPAEDVEKPDQDETEPDEEKEEEPVQVETKSEREACETKSFWYCYCGWTKMKKLADRRMLIKER